MKMSIIPFLPYILTIAFLCASVPTRAEKLDASQCEMLGNTGFCKVSRETMAGNCPGTCAFVEKYGPNFKKFPSYKIKNDVNERFFDLEAKDYRGKSVDFGDHEGYITLVVNMENSCAYLDVMLPILSRLRKTYSYLLEVMIFPEPRKSKNPELTECDGVKEHASKLGKGKIIIMEESDVHDPEHPVFSYFKSKFEKEGDLDKDKSTFFLVTPDGNLELHRDMNSELLRIVVNAHAMKKHNMEF